MTFMHLSLSQSNNIAAEMAGIPATQVEKIEMCAF